MLLNRGADVCALNELQQSSLGVAIHSGKLEFIEMVCNHSVNSNTDDLLHLAAKLGNEAAVVLLLSYGVNVESRDFEGRTPLHVTTQPEVVETFLKLGADVNAQDKKGQTPLHLAAMGDNGALIDLLIWYGADINIIDCEGNVPLDCALDSYLLTVESNYGDLTAEYVQQFLFQIIRMQKVNWYVNKNNLDALCQAQEDCESTDEFVSSITVEIEQEVDEMKRVMVNNSLVSFYDFLSKSSLALVVLRNDGVVAGFEDSHYQREFPMYGNLIYCQFKMVTERKVLIEQGCKIFEILCGYGPKLPLFCREMIFSWLSNKELKVFVDACKYRSIV